MKTASLKVLAEEEDEALQLIKPKADSIFGEDGYKIVSIRITWSHEDNMEWAFELVEQFTTLKGMVDSPSGHTQSILPQPEVASEPDMFEALKKRWENGEFDELDGNSP